MTWGEGDRRSDQRPTGAGGAKMIAKQKDEFHSENQARAQLESIKEMIAALDLAGEDDNARDDAYQIIQEDPLSVEVRSDWHSPGDRDTETAEYNILLCTGGPACRIVGELDKWAQPETASIEHQDWGTPWTKYPLNREDEAIVVRYAQCFYFGE